MRRCQLHGQRAVQACVTPCAREGCGHDCRLHLSTGSPGRHYPGACYAADCKCPSYLEKAKMMVAPSVGTIIRNPMPCFCGAKMPWDMIVTVTDVNYTYTCENGHGWAWYSTTKARYTGYKGVGNAR